MKWFQRHLNWTLVLTWLAMFPIGVIVGFIMGMFDPYISDESIMGLTIIVGLPWILLTNGWVIKKKGRSLWWLLVVFIPFIWGLIILLFLKNRSEQKALERKEAEAKADETPRLVPIEKKTKSKMKIVISIVVIAIIALVAGFVPIMEVPYTVTEPLDYQVTSFVNQEKVERDPRFILGTVAFSKDVDAVTAALHEAYPPPYPACRVVVQNTDDVSGIFTVHFTFYLSGDQDTKDVTFALFPDELGMASYEAKGVNFDGDEWSWEYEVTPDTKAVTHYRKAPIFEYLLSRF